MLQGSLKPFIEDVGYEVGDTGSASSNERPAQNSQEEQRTSPSAESSCSSSEVSPPELAKDGGGTTSVCFHRIC